jgi:DNA-directed RNA polymerase subunit M/transcription elongation factor TFIIS
MRARKPPPPHLLAPRQPETHSHAHQLRNNVVLDNHKNKEHKNEDQEQHHHQQEETDSEQEISCPCHQQQEHEYYTQGLSVNIQRQLIIDISLNSSLDFFRL